MAAPILLNSQFGHALPFRAGPDLPLLERSLDYIPRYLFRTYAPRSNGSTDETVVEAPAASRPIGNVDLLQLPRDRAASTLWNHLNWKTRNGNWSRDHDDNLMSWTSSLFFAIQHGLRRHHTDFDNPKLSNIRICVVDTRKFPRGTFVKDLDLMEAYVDFEDVGSLLSLRLSAGGWYFGEYLSQGRLDIQGRSGHTSLCLLLDMGLYDLEPRFQEEQDRLAARIVELRAPFAAMPLITCPAAKLQVRKAIAAAQASFGDEYALPFALMLLSLCPRPRQDRAILAGFEATFTDEEIAHLSLHTLTVDGERLPEVQQFADLAHDLRLHLTPEGSALNPFVVDNLYSRLASPELPIDLTQIDNIASSLSGLRVSQRG
ncbi:hypothetical protein BR93DRAFT_963280 [Coniochaeta sp. PMI_546]|nr:hypothetical protein BR93DRAFT_963280 [Coniochaeta sp. PMI_546]